MTHSHTHTYTPDIIYHSSSIYVVGLASIHFVNETASLHFRPTQHELVIIPLDDITSVNIEPMYDGTVSRIAFNITECYTVSSKIATDVLCIMNNV